MKLLVAHFEQPFILCVQLFRVVKSYRHSLLLRLTFCGHCEPLFTYLKMIFLNLSNHPKRTLHC